jgi:hypothetical protein
MSIQKEPKKVSKKKDSKKNKQTDVLNNYKNIETFDTLSNVANPKSSPDSTNKGIPAPLSLSLLPPTIAILDLSNIAHSKDEIEGFAVGTPRDPEDYEGEDDLLDRSNNDDPRERLIQFINYLYDKIDSIVMKIAHEVAKVAGREEPELTDILIVKPYVSLFLSITVSMFAVYNWIFMMFYKDNFRYKEGIKMVDISRARLTNAAFDEEGSSLFFIPLYFFEFSMFFPEKIQEYVVELLPKITSHFINGTFSFFIMFYLLIFVFNNMGSQLRDFLIRIIRLDTSNYFVNLMYTIVIILFIASYFVFITAPIQSALKLATEHKFEFPRIPIYMYPVFIPFPIVGSILSIILTLVVHSIRLIITCFMSVPVGGIFMALYILFYSFFGIFLYKFLNNDKNTLFATMRDIDNFTKDTKHQIPAGTPCSPNSFFEMVIMTINMIIDFFHSYIFYIAYIVMLIYGVFDYYQHISRHHLKTGMLVINVTLILMLVMFCIASFIAEHNKKITNIIVPPTITIVDELKRIYKPMDNSMEKPKTMFESFFGSITST